MTEDGSGLLQESEDEDTNEQEKDSNEHSEYHRARVVIENTTRCQ